MADTTGPSPKRRLPFKRTVARKKTPETAQDGDAPKKPADDDDEDVQFFRRNRDAFSYFEDLEAPKTSKAKESSRPSSKGDDEDEPDHKRRKVSLEPDAERDSGVGSISTTPRKSSPPPAPMSDQLTLSSSDDDIIMDVKGKGRAIDTPPRRGTQGRASAGTYHNNLISLDDSDDEFEPASPIAPVKHERAAPRTRSQPEAPEPVSLDDSDPDVLVIEENGSPDVKIVEGGGTEDDDLDDEFAREIEQARARARAKASGADSGLPTGGAAITIMVDAPGLPNAVPCNFRRRVGQPLSVVLSTWIQLQASKGSPLPPGIESKLFLTWRRNKIFGAASVLTLPGFEIDAAGNIKGNARAGKDGGIYEGGLYLEAWTEELLAEHERERQRERQLSLGILDDEDLQELDEPASQEAKQPKGIRVILKAKELEPVKLTVQTHTTVDTMIAAFRQQRDLDDASDVSIFFDGEELEPDSQVGELDIDADDTNQLEVHIK
ncbi:hypothetical protein GQ53DRAFT_847565 [Thozetella sp. PMI_491]|nr:hypothetical protein GQ53DRAFT_847565 [Thozetella sp. PMI_491]